ncbi:hypothetical protein M8J76_015574 [Diaphorina citri]|nr:hypothetical protein M8J76_015574 [Diaphorina citri]
MNGQPQKSSRFLYSPNSAKSPAPTPSLSGSETDVSTSTENLSFEEQYVMRNTTRQEPQGQENRNSLDSASYNTLIIHEENRLSGAGTPPGYQISKVSSPVPSSIKLSGAGTPPGYQISKVSSPVPSSIKSPSVAAVASSSSDSGVREITQIPDDYLSQSQVLKHLAKEVKVVSPGSRDDEVNNAGSSTSSAGKHYQSYSTTSSGKSKKTRSKSQPDLSQLELTHKGDSVPGNSLGASSSRKEQRCMQMIERLMQENSGLKMELEACYQRVSKSQKLEQEVGKLEQEVGKVHRAHEDLVESCERRERLERAARVRLQGEVRRLQEANRSLQSHAELLSNQVVSLRGADNKELIAAKDRQEIELAAQRATLEEQRTHIDILDTALTNAQSNVVRLEEECRKKQLYVERVAQLQRALSSLQLASDRREQTERKLRLQLERELRNERARNSNTQDTTRNSNTQDTRGSDGDPGENIAELKRRLREKDEKIMRLEGEVAKWEQRYLEESELRQAAIDAASIPKDAKIAALEKTSMESEKLIAEARSDKLKQMDEVHAANKKELESKLAERDAMIRVLQKKHHGHHTTYEKDYLHHSPRSSELTTDDLVGPVSSGSVFTTSTGFGSSASYTGSVDSAFHHHHSHSTRSNKYSSSANQSFDAKSLDDQLKELDSQLLSKVRPTLEAGTRYTTSAQPNARPTHENDRGSSPPPQARPRGRLRATRTRASTPPMLDKTDSRKRKREAAPSGPTPQMCVNAPNAQPRRRTNRCISTERQALRFDMKCRLEAPTTTEGYGTE